VEAIAAAAATAVEVAATAVGVVATAAEATNRVEATEAAEATEPQNIVCMLVLKSEKFPSQGLLSCSPRVLLSPYAF
jgi:hypothetical protein